MINEPALLLRKKNAIFPEGRTSYRFKNALRHKVMINGETMFGPGKMKKKKKVKRPATRPSEMDQPETDEPDRSVEEMMLMGAVK